MKITQILLQNFMPFYGEVTIEPYTEDDRPLVLVKGENDTGKTSLHTGIKYCFHGVENRSQRGEFINREAATEGDGVSKVAISFEADGGDIYTIERGVEFSQVEDPDNREAEKFFLQVLDADGNDIVSSDAPRNEYTRFVNQFIPENVADFFFFDAEQLEKFEEANDKEVREAIETVLGIKEIENSVSDLNYRKEQYEREYSKIESTIEEVQEHQEELNNILDEKDRLAGTEDSKGEIQKKKDEIETKRQQLDDIQSELASIDEGDDKREQLDRVKEDLESVVRDLDDKTSERNTLRRRAGPLLAANCAGTIQQLYDVDGTADEAAVINDIINNREECLCGLNLEKHPDHRQELMERWKKLGSSERKKVAGLLELANSGLNIGIRKELDRYQRLQSDIRQNRTRAEDLRDEKDALEQELEEIERAHQSKLKDREEEVKAELKQLEDERDELQTRWGELNNEHEQLQSRISSQREASAEEERYQKLIDLTSRCKEAMEDIRSELVENRRETVEKHASDTFLELTNRPNYYRGLKITDNYELRVLTEESERSIAEQRPSEGQKQIIAYAFIAGLSEYATRNAPVVVDTPIGRLDPTHKNNLLDYYHRFSDQVMILYQPSELEGSDIDRIEDRTSKHYQIKYRDDSQNSSTIQERELSVDAITGDD